MSGSAAEPSTFSDSGDAGQGPSESLPAKSAVDTITTTTVQGPADGGKRWPSSLPPFPAFCRELITMFDATKRSNVGMGNLSSQAPWLAKADPSSFGFAVCTVGGSQFCYGDALVPFTLQQCSYPISLAVSIGLAGLDKVANVVGFYAAEIADAFTLNADKKPYNPLILTGALAVCGQLYPAQEPSARLQSCLEAYTGLSSPPQLPFNGCGTLSVSMPAYLTLSQDLDNKTRGVAHWLRANGLVAQHANVDELADLFFSALLR